MRLDTADVHSKFDSDGHFVRAVFIILNPSAELRMNHKVPLLPSIGEQFRDGT
jgi:hypothetical protein